MTPELYSVEQVADRLGLHVRTIRRYVRDGRLNAVRVGRQYRISRAALDAFTGIQPLDRPRRVEASCIVQVEAVDRAGADRISTHLMAALNSRSDGRLRVETAYDEDRAELKVIVLGDLAVAADLLGLIAVLAADNV